MSLFQRRNRQVSNFGLSTCNDSRNHVTNVTYPAPVGLWYLIGTTTRRLVRTARPWSSRWLDAADGGTGTGPWRPLAALASGCLRWAVPVPVAAAALFSSDLSSFRDWWAQPSRPPYHRTAVTPGALQNSERALRTRLGAGRADRGVADHGMPGVRTPLSSHGWI